MVVGNFELEIEVGNLKSKLNIGIMNKKLELEIENGIGYVHNAFYWRGLELESWNRKSKFEIKLEILNGNWTEIVIGNQLRIDIWNWDWKSKWDIEIT